MISLMSYTNNNPSYPSRYSIGEGIRNLQLPPIATEVADADYAADPPSTNVSPSAHPMGPQPRPIGAADSNDSYFQYSPSRYYAHQTYQHQQAIPGSASTTASPPLAFSAQAKPQYYYYPTKQGETQPVQQYTHANQSYNQYLYYQQQSPQQQPQPQPAPGMYPTLIQGNPGMHMQHSPMSAPGTVAYMQGMGMPGMPPVHPRRRSKQSTTWSAKEDKLLRELKEVQKLGWREISSFFQDRTPNACQFRWRRIISGTSTGTSIHNLHQHGNSERKKSHHSINFLLN